MSMMYRLLFVLHNAWTLRSHTVDNKVVLSSLCYSNTTCTISTATLIATIFSQHMPSVHLFARFDRWWMLYSQGCNSENWDGLWNVRVDVNTTNFTVCGCWPLTDVLKNVGLQLEQNFFFPARLAEMVPQTQCNPRTFASVQSRCWMFY